MRDLILHHYDLSPYAEKVRLMLGLKGLFNAKSIKLNRATMSRRPTSMRRSPGKRLARPNWNSPLPSPKPT